MHHFDEFSLNAVDNLISVLIQRTVSNMGPNQDKIRKLGRPQKGGTLSICRQVNSFQIHEHQLLSGIGVLL